MANLNTIKNWFKTGSKPTQQQFSDTWDSFWHKYDNIPVAKIDGVDNLLNQKANKSVVDNHLTDSNAHAEKFSTKEDKSKKGQAGGYAPLDEFVKIAADYLLIVDDLVTGGTDRILSAQQGVELQSQINQINVLLESNDVNLDNVQELVDAIKTIQTSLQTILINDLTTGGVTKALTAEQGLVLKQLIDLKVSPTQLQQVARPYKVYTAVMSQSGTNAPQATILENTIGEIIWSRVSAGIYRGTLASGFTFDKMALFYGATANLNSGHIFTIYREDYNNLIIRTSNQYATADGNFLPNTIEIRIYD
jgi:hypothetical protein